MSAGTTVAGAALAGVGGVVEMSGLVVGVSSVSRSSLPCWIKSRKGRTGRTLNRLVSSRQATINSSLHVDPTSHESLIATSRVTLACMPALGKITNVWQTGEIEGEKAMEVSVFFTSRRFSFPNFDERPSSQTRVLTCLCSFSERPRLWRN